MLKNKNILLGVTGSIAIYKSLELIRLYIKAGANVKVIMSSASKKFITPLCFETISQSKILDDENECWDKNSHYNHIAIGKWADIFIVAPCSVNTINKIAIGISDNILTQSLIAYPKVKLLAPAANTNMVENPITLKNLEALKLCNYKIIEPVSKELACRDIGSGALSDVSDIFYASVRELLKEDYWTNRKVVLSGGGTRERIDDIRYISNFSSGKMASSLALALYLKGAEVSLITSKDTKDLPKEIKCIAVDSSNEMYSCLKEIISSFSSKKNKMKKKSYLFMVAAISDYIPKNIKKGKFKKENIGKTWDLSLKENIDILNSLEKKDLISIGFKAETNKDDALKNALKMLEKKSLDAVCLNIIDENNTFGSNTNKINLLTKNSTYKSEGIKIDVSFDILDNLSKEFNDS